MRYTTLLLFYTLVIRSFYKTWSQAEKALKYYKPGNNKQNFSVRDTPFIRMELFIPDPLCRQGRELGAFCDICNIFPALCNVLALANKDLCLIIRHVAQHEWHFAGITVKLIKTKQMKKASSILSGILLAVLLMASCKSMNKTQKGAVIGTAGGAVAGAVIGEIAGNAQLGALIGAAVGGVTGAIIGRKMDKQAEEIKNKIPDAKVERIGEGIVIEFNDKILFGFDESRLSADARVSMGKLVTVLKDYPDTNIEIQGHTDEKGSMKYNQALSIRRADAVSSYLRQSGLPASRLTVKGFGESSPKYTSTTKEGNAQNRRVEFLVSANEKMKEEAAKEAAKESNN